MGREGGRHEEDAAAPYGVEGEARAALRGGREGGRGGEEEGEEELHLQVLCVLPEKIFGFSESCHSPFKGGYPPDF